MFGISGFELLILAAFVLIIFGPDKLPQLVKTFSNAMRMFKSAQADMERLVKAEMLMGDKFDFEKALKGESTAATSATSTGSSKPSIESSDTPAIDDSAATVWAATAEDDDEEEDEE